MRGIILYPMCSEMTVISWNSRGPGSQEKATIRRLVRRYKPVIVGRQETKVKKFSMKHAQAFWGDKVAKFTSVAAKGLSGGTATLWDPDQVTVTDVLKGEFSLSIRCKSPSSGDEWICVIVYGPSVGADKPKLWEELRDVLSFWRYLA